MNSKEFRAELVKVMPGYNWTVHQSSMPEMLDATGIQTSGFNRLSTLAVTRKDRDGVVTYEAKSSGYGLKAPWLHRHVDVTLARALRGLQNHYEAMETQYRAHATALKHGRVAPAETDAPEHQGIPAVGDSTDQDEVAAPGMSA